MARRRSRRHRRRRTEGIPLLEAKFRENVALRFSGPRQKAILDASFNQRKLETMPVNEYVDLYAK